jgi:PAB1-binding protein PBP1
LTTYQIAANQLTSGVRVPAKIVPAVTEVSDRQAEQRRSPSAICHQPPSTVPQKRQVKPAPQRSRSR